MLEEYQAEIPPEIFADKDHLREFLTDTFLELNNRITFAENWIETFLLNIYVLR